MWPGREACSQLCLFDYLDNMACEARDLLVVARMHYHTKQEEPGVDNLGREDYIKDIRERWNHPW